MVPLIFFSSLYKLFETLYLYLQTYKEITIMEEFKFAEFKPLVQANGLNKEDIRQYYLENNLVPDNPFMNRYLNLQTTAASPVVPSLVVPQSTTPSNFTDSFSDESTTKTTSVFSKENYQPLFDSVSKIASENPANIKISKNSTDTGKQIMNYLTSQGFAKHVAAGIVGNLFTESGLNPNAVGDKHLKTSSEGLAQWREGRLANLKSYAKSTGKDYRSINTQLEFMMHELNTSENSTLKKLKQAKTAKEAARIFAYGYERMKTYDTKRENLAEKFLQA